MLHLKMDKQLTQEVLTTKEMVKADHIKGTPLMHRRITMMNR
jgi:hypothetical protein